MKNKMDNRARLPLPRDCQKDLVPPVPEIGRQHAIGSAVYYSSVDDSWGLSLPVRRPTPRRQAECLHAPRSKSVTLPSSHASTPNHEIWCKCQHSNYPSVASFPKVTQQPNKSVPQQAESTKAKSSGPSHLIPSVKCPYHSTSERDQSDTTTKQLCELIKSSSSPNPMQTTTLVAICNPQIDQIPHYLHIGF